jgi:ribosome biogenesis SPOUT family RNA methylase Rps3
MRGRTLWQKVSQSCKICELKASVIKDKIKLYKTKMKFVIEHLDPELFKWCLIEYEHISTILGKNNLIFTNIPKKEKNKLTEYGIVEEKGISELNFKKICVLSQYAPKTLTTSDKEGFDYFVFGGILGDNPAKKRTIDIINSLKKSKMKFEERNLGSKQMPTDIAVYVTKTILDGKRLDELRFVDEVEIEINENECVNLPFRYIIDDKNLVISEKLVEHLRKAKEF